MAMKQKVQKRLYSDNPKIDREYERIRAKFRKMGIIGKYDFS